MRYNYYPSSSVGSNSDTAMAVCFVLALIAGIILHFTFLSKKNEGRFTGFLGGLYNFLNFKKLLVEKLLKIIYLILACWLTLVSFVCLFSATENFGINLLLFLTVLVVGNLLMRIIYEALLLRFIICQNTSEIRSKLGKDKVESLTQSYQGEYNQLPYREPQYEQPQQITEYCQNCGAAQFDPSGTICQNCGTPRF